MRIIDQSELSAELGVSLVSPSKPVPLSPQNQQFSKSPERPVSIKREQKSNISDKEPERKKTRMTNTNTTTNNNSNSMDVVMATNNVNTNGSAGGDGSNP